MYTDLAASPSTIKGVQSIADAKGATSIKFQDSIEEAGVAVWWPESPPGGFEAHGSDDTRVLQGEVHLRPTLTPSSHIGHFKLSVSAYSCYSLECV